jgi:hypothetical protein
MSNFDRDAYETIQTDERNASKIEIALYVATMIIVTRAAHSPSSPAPSARHTASRLDRSAQPSEGTAVAQCNPVM